MARTIVVMAKTPFPESEFHVDDPAKVGGEFSGMSNVPHFDAMAAGVRRFLPLNEPVSIVLQGTGSEWRKALVKGDLHSDDEATLKWAGLSKPKAEPQQKSITEKKGS